MNKLHGNALRNTRIKLSYRSALETRLGNAINGAPRDGIVAMTVTVNEPDAASAMLEMARVPHQEARSIVTVPASAAHGIVLQMAED